MPELLFEKGGRRSSPLQAAGFPCLYYYDDGSILAHLPLKAIRIGIIESGLTDEQKAAAGERLKAMRERKARDEDGKGI